MESCPYQAYSLAVLYKAQKPLIIRRLNCELKKRRKKEKKHEALTIWTYYRVMAFWVYSTLIKFWNFIPVLPSVFFLTTMRLYYGMAVAVYRLKINDLFSQSPFSEYKLLGQGFLKNWRIVSSYSYLTTYFPEDINTLLKWRPSWLNELGSWIT